MYTRESVYSGFMYIIHIVCVCVVCVVCVLCVCVCCVRVCSRVPSKSFHSGYALRLDRVSILGH
jgi:hypothetical protein